MKIESPHFGTIEVDDDKVIDFPQGLPGFEDCHHFALMHPDEEQSQLFYLQCVEQPEVSFSITSPDQFGLHYEFSLSDAELELVGTGSPADIAVMVLLRREPDVDGVKSPVRAVLTAPLIINLATRRAMQKSRSQIGCDITLKAAS